MARIIPAAFPTLATERQLDPGQGHWDTHAQALIEGAHHVLINQGRGHVNEVWPGRQTLVVGAPTLNPGRMELTAIGAMTQVPGTYVIYPRAHTDELSYRVMVCSDNGCKYQLDCYNDAGVLVGTYTSALLAGGVVIDPAVGLAAGVIAYPGDRGGLRTRIVCSLLVPVGSTYADFLSISLWDSLSALP